MTPSEAHDEAWKRDPGHDEMQLAVLRAARREFQFADWARKEGAVRCRLAFSRAECLFARKGSRLFFADIAMRFVGEAPRFLGQPGVERFELWRLFEIKPVIYSAGALLRQCAIIDMAMHNWLEEENRDDLAAVKHVVMPVVPAADPKVQLLADLGERPVMTWDGSRLAFVHPAEEDTPA